MAKKIPPTKFMKSEMNIAEVAKKCIELGWKISKSSDEMIIAKTPTSFFNFPHIEKVEIVKEDGGYIVNSQYFHAVFRYSSSHDPVGKNAKNLDKIQKFISPFCESCGAKIKANQVICVKCGVKL